MNLHTTGDDCDVFLSINHEAGAFTVRDLLESVGVKSTRTPSWMRLGYVEELVRFS